MDAFGGSEVTSLLYTAVESLFILLYQLKARWSRLELLHIIKYISIIIKIVSQRKICALFLDCTRQNFASLTVGSSLIRTAHVQLCCAEAPPPDFYQVPMVRDIQIFIKQYE